MSVFTHKINMSKILGKFEPWADRPTLDAEACCHCGTFCADLQPCLYRGEKAGICPSCAKDIMRFQAGENDE
jgi:hypothetical protein